MPLRPRLLAATVAAAFVAPALLVAPLPAQAATKPTVSITTIKNRTAPFHKSVSVGLPSVTSKGAVDLGATTFTIKHGKKTVAKNATSASLKAGTYKVTTTARYRTFKDVTTTETEVQPYVLPAGDSVPASCTVTAEVPVPDTEAQYTVTADCTSADYVGSRSLTGQASGDSDLGYSITLDQSHDAPAGSFDDSLVGITFPANVYFLTDTEAIHEVTVEHHETVYSATKKKVRTQKLVIHQGHRPGRTDPVSEYNCPSWAPIKGNAQSMIYHMPGQRFYKVTKPEDCFSTQAAARKAGYRKSKV